MHACMQILQKKKRDFDYFSVCLPQFIVGVGSKQQICFFFFFNYACKVTITCGVWEDSFCSISMHSRELTRRETKKTFLLLLHTSGTHKSYWIENLF